MAVGAGLRICIAKDDRRDGNEGEQAGDHKGQRFVALFHHDRSLTSHAPGDGDGAEGRSSGPFGLDAAEPELFLGPQHRNAVPWDDLMVTARALGHLRAVTGHDGHRRQVAEMAPEGRVGGHGVLAHLHLHHGEVHAGELYVVSWAS